MKKLRITKSLPSRIIAATALCLASQAAVLAEDGGPDSWSGQAVPSPVAPGEAPSASGAIGSPGNPLVMVPGKTTVADLVGIGLKEITAEEYNKANGGSAGAGFSYISFNDFLVVAKDGVTTSFYFSTAKKGAVPPEWMIGVALDPKASYRGLVSFLSKNGFTLRQIQTPHATFSDTAPGKDYQVSGSFVARGTVNSDIAYVFSFDTHDFWTADAPGTLDRITAYPVSYMDKFKTQITVPSLPPEGDERQRALDLSVLLSVQNRGGYTRLMPDRPGAENNTPKAWQQFVNGSWSIGSREDFLRTYDDMVAEGHASSYTEAMALLDANPGVPIARLAIAKGLDSYHCDRLFFVAQTREWLGSRSLKAWDLARMINVSRWAYGAGYITEDEAWERILPVAKTLRGLYHSREDFIASYIGGRGFFGAGDPSTYMEDAYESFVDESAKLDSRQLLPWYLPGEGPAPGSTGGRDAKIADISYVVSDEQAAARETYKRLNGSIDRANAAIKANDASGALAAMDTAEIILKGNAVGEFRPDLYYRIRFVRATILMAIGDYAPALAALEEVDACYPGDTEVRKLMQTCRDNLGGR